MLYEIIERYQVLPSKKELKTLLFSSENGGSEFLSVHYHYIEGLIKDACNNPGTSNPYLLHYLKTTWKKYDKNLQDVITRAIEDNGLRWFISFIGDGNKRAEQIIYKISGGTVNLGNGVQVIDSVLNRTGISNEIFNDSGLSEGTSCSPGGTFVQDSVINRSEIGDSSKKVSSENSGRFCIYCGTKLVDGAQFCCNCGKGMEL